MARHESEGGGGGGGEREKAAYNTIVRKLE